MNIAGKNYTKQEILGRTGNISQLAGAQKYTTTEGIGQGTNIIRVQNGSGLDVTLLPDKALDIFDAGFRGIPLAWKSKNGLVSNKFFDDKGMGWLRSFGGGLLTTCGMRNAGPPVDDDEHFGLHGRVSSVPAEKVSINEYWKQDEYYIEVSGQTREANTFGENLVNRRKMLFSSEHNCIEIFDTIVNEGFSREQIMLLYHLNWGFPLFCEEAQLILDPENTIVRDDNAEPDSRADFSGPITGFKEIVYFHDLKADANNNVSYELINPKLGIKVRVSWNKAVLPYLIEWKMTGQGEYVLGLEPGNCLAGGRITERQEGRAEYLDSFEEKNIHMTIDVESL